MVILNNLEIIQNKNHSISVLLLLLSIVAIIQNITRHPCYKINMDTRLSNT